MCLCFCLRRSRIHGETILVLVLVTQLKTGLKSLFFLTKLIIDYVQFSGFFVVIVLVLYMSQYSGIFL